MDSMWESMPDLSQEKLWIAADPNTPFLEWRDLFLKGCSEAFNNPAFELHMLSYYPDPSMDWITPEGRACRAILNEMACSTPRLTDLGRSRALELVRKWWASCNAPDRMAWFVQLLCRRSSFGSPEHIRHLRLACLAMRFMVVSPGELRDVVASEIISSVEDHAPFLEGSIEFQLIADRLDRLKASPPWAWSEQRTLHLANLLLLASPMRPSAALSYGLEYVANQLGSGPSVADFIRLCIPEVIL